MTPEEIRAGEVAIAKWLGWKVTYSSQMDHILIGPNGNRHSYYGQTEEVAWEKSPRYSIGDTAFCELLEELAKRGFKPSVHFGGSHWYAATEITYRMEGRAGTPQMALFKATLQLPEVQALLNKTTEASV